MPNDNAFLSSTIHLGYVSDDFVIAHLKRANESIRFVGPGLSEVVAKVVAERWYALGPRAVEVVIDSDSDVCRLGFGDGGAIEILFKTADALDTLVCRLPGIRLCVLEIDGERIIYPPTPRLVEHSDPVIAEVILSPGTAPTEGSASAGLYDQILAPPELRQEPLSESEVKRLGDDLKQSPPLPFDLARQVRVLSLQFQFVEFSLLKAALARKRVSVPPDLLGLTRDRETEELLRASFQLVGREDEVSGEALLKRRDEIDKKYLCPIADYGKVILSSNRVAFDTAVAALKNEVEQFRKSAVQKLNAAIEKNCAIVVNRLLGVVQTTLPERWIATMGTKPTGAQIKLRLEDELKRSYGNADRYLGNIEVRLVYKNVTVEMLKDVSFRAAAAKAKLNLDEMYEEYDAARSRMG